MAKIVRPDGSTIQRLLVDKQTGSVQMAGRWAGGQRCWYVVFSAHQLLIKVLNIYNKYRVIIILSSISAFLIV
jgi:hypothetical protein